jgi:hypothetical protein
MALHGRCMGGVDVGSTDDKAKLPLATTARMDSNRSSNPH